jgi:hypothetical protein
MIAVEQREHITDCRLQALNSGEGLAALEQSRQMLKRLIPGLEGCLQRVTVGRD